MRWDVVLEFIFPDVVELDPLVQPLKVKCLWSSPFKHYNHDRYHLSWLHYDYYHDNCPLWCCWTGYAGPTTEGDDIIILFSKNCIQNVTGFDYLHDQLWSLINIISPSLILIISTWRFNLIITLSDMSFITMFSNLEEKLKQCHDYYQILNNSLFQISFNITFSLCHFDFG